jgi:hypothetical protein
MSGIPGSGGDVSGAVATETDVLARETYRHLRLMLVMQPLLIVVAIVALLFNNIVESSISAYYGQSIRDVFVGGMVGTAVCLIVYRGFPPFEDFALNLAGFYAVFVAFVPGTLAEDMAELTEEGQDEALIGLRVSIGAVVLVTIVFIALERRVGHWTLPTLMRRPATGLAVIIAYAVGLAFLCFVAVRGFFNDDFANVHGIAAILLFASLAMAVATHGWPSKFGGENEPRYQKIFWLMVAGILIALILKFVFKSDYTVLLLELWEITWFAVFWGMEAKRTWRAPSLRESLTS